MYYDPKSKTIITCGGSRPCGKNHGKPSLHAEQIAINYCLKNDKRNKYKIFISRFDKTGHHRSTFCCHACTKVAKKYNMLDKIYTFDNNEIISAVKEDPQISLGYKMRHGWN
tara:strand:- start:584 stop:919 length:336 start_codon:yes stop_codon:yes gene_type:complete